MTRRVLAVSLAAALVLVGLWWLRASETQSTSMSAIEVPNEIVAQRLDSEPAATQPVAPSVSNAPESPPRFRTIEEFRAAVAEYEANWKVDDVSALRARAFAGDGEAALKMVRHVNTCRGRELLTDEQVIARFQEQDRHSRPARDEHQQRMQDENRKSRERAELRGMFELRQLCPQVRDDDVDHLLDWLEAALAARNPELIWGLSTHLGLPLPADTAWRVRHAERLASFVIRARAVYEEGMAAGNRRLLERGGFFYSNRYLWRTIDPYKVYLYSLIGDAVTHEENLPDVQFRQQRLDRLGEALSEAERVRAQQEAQERVRRCCAEG